MTWLNSLLVVCLLSTSQLDLPSPTRPPGRGGRIQAPARST